MTRLRIDKTYQNSFMDWIRNQITLDSNEGFRCYDVDSILWRLHSNRWMLLESKTHGVTVDGMRPHQRHTLEVLHRSLSLNPEIQFVGTFCITFENTNPSDGYTVFARFDGNFWTRYYSKRCRMNEKEFLVFLIFGLTGKR